MLWIGPGADSCEPSEAHWQMGKAEWKVRVLKEVSQTVFVEMDVRDGIASRIAVGRIAVACNTL